MSSFETIASQLNRSNQSLSLIRIKVYQITKEIKLDQIIHSHFLNLNPCYRQHQIKAFLKKNRLIQYLPVILNDSRQSTNLYFTPGSIFAKKSLFAKIRTGRKLHVSNRHQLVDLSQFRKVLVTFELFDTTFQLQWQVYQSSVSPLKLLQQWPSLDQKSHCNITIYLSKLSKAEGRVKLENSLLDCVVIFGTQTNFNFSFR